MQKNIGLLLSIIVFHVCGQLISTPFYFNSQSSDKFVKKLVLDFMTHTFNKYNKHKYYKAHKYYIMIIEKRLMR